MDAWTAATFTAAAIDKWHLPVPACLKLKAVEKWNKNQTKKKGNANSLVQGELVCIVG